MLLDDVRTALEQRAEHVPAGSVAPGEVLARVQRAVRRRRLTVAAVAGTTVVIAIAVAISALVAVSNSRNDRVLTVPESTTALGSGPKSPFSVAQMDAHEGVGVPAGWLPVDAGLARIFVPSSWSLEVRGSCHDSVLGGIVAIGKLALVGCGRARVSPPEGVSLIPSNVHAFGPLDRVVHGYRIFRAARAEAIEGWHVYFVPSLQVEIAIRGDSADQILGTLATSARNVAISLAPNHPAPAGRTVTANGITVTIPRSWVVATPGQPSCGWPQSFRGAAPEFLTIRPGLGVTSCLPPQFDLEHVFKDGLLLDTSTRGRSGASGKLLATQQNGSTTIRVYAEQNQPNVLVLLVARASSRVTHRMYLALGHDGRVAAGVLASIVATA